MVLLLRKKSSSSFAGNSMYNPSTRFCFFPPSLHWAFCLITSFVCKGYASLCRTLGAGVGHIFDTRKICCYTSYRCCLSLFIFDRVWGVCGCMCMYTRTHTRTARGVLGWEHRGRDEALGEHAETRWTESQNTYICTCVRRTHVSYIWRRDEILDYQLIFSYHIFVLPKK